LPKDKKILFLSNGYGEDNVSAYIAKKLKEKNPDFIIKGFPSVGEGKFYQELGLKLAGRGTNLPGEGFIRNIKDFFIDINNGLITQTLRVGVSIKKISKNFDYIIITGDPYLLLFVSLFTTHKKNYKIFIGIQQSEWYESRKAFKQHYSLIERFWLKKFSNLIFVRDYKTRDYLKYKGLNCVECMGNPMMDCFSINNNSIFPRDKKIIGILPGSKKEAYNNIQVIFRIIEELLKKRRDLIFAFAISPNLNIKNIVEIYKLKEIRHEYIEDSIVYTLYKLNNSRADIILSNKIFGDIISKSDLIIGTSGTGNEQATGMGKAVFSFWGNGPQITKKFLHAQKRLLGISLFVYPPDPELIAKNILKVLDNRELLRKIKKNGEKRMEGRGSIEKIVAKIDSYLKGNQ